MEEEKRAQKRSQEDLLERTSHHHQEEKKTPEGCNPMRKVLVTGGNKGIGKAICQLLLEKYPDVHVLLGSRDVDRGNQAVRDILREVGAGKCQGRLDMLQVDISNDESVRNAAASLENGTQLYGIVNNGGVNTRTDFGLSINVNYMGARRINDAFLVKLERPGGRIVHVSSASGPIYVAGCNDADLATKLEEPWRIAGGVKELDAMATHQGRSGNAYGFAKACLSAYTWLLAKEHPDLIINAVTPGFINTDMTATMGATNPPSKGAIPPVYLLMDEELTQVPTGRYYGSDCKRSPWHEYRRPGDPVYEGPDGK